MNIKKEVGKVQDELTKYGLMTPGKGIDFIVSLSVENIENNKGKMTKHIIAKWNEYSAVTDSIVEREKVSELDRYFSGELFGIGITQRAAWIKGDPKDQKAYLKENQFGHPALFPVWLESKKVA